MSLVYITYHDENIFNVEKHWAMKRGVKPDPRYVSKFKKQVREDSRKMGMVEMADGKKLLTGASKNKHKTMGYAETPLDPPCAFLRKQQGVKWRRLNEHVCPKSGGMPPVPRYERTHEKHEKQEKMLKKKEPPVDVHCPQRRYFKNHKHRANFIAVNIDRTKKTPVKRPPPRYVDTPTGETHNLLNTGLIPQYICAKNFGKVPCYLRIQKKMLQDLRKRCVDEQQDLEYQCHKHLMPGVRPLTAAERQEILAGLKNNFTELNKIYQKLPLCTDTIPKRVRKSKIEKELRQMEQDMYLIESNPMIFISEY